jgi:hypothetical protein
MPQIGLTFGPNEEDLHAWVERYCERTGARPAHAVKHLLRLIKEGDLKAIEALGSFSRPTPHVGHRARAHA